MGKRKRRKRTESAEPNASAPTQSKSALVVKEKPLRVAKALCGVLLLVGAIMLCMGIGVASGTIKEGWGFPMSAVPNWGKPWGMALIIAATAYIVGPILLLTRPQRGSIVLLIVCGLSVVIGVPLITTTTEIFYNLFQETKSRPAWIDSVWAYYMFLNVGICVALYKAYPPPEDKTDVARAS